MIFLCVCSFFWHASLTKLGANMDMGAIYLLISYILALVLMRAGHYGDLIRCGSILLGRRQPRYSEDPLLTVGGICDGGLRTHWIVTAIVGFMLGMVLLYMKVGNHMGEIDSLQILVLLVGPTICGVFCFPWPRSRILKSSWVFLQLGILILLLGLIVRQGDQKRGWFCQPTNYHGHALFHVLASVSIFLFYLFFRSETLKLLPESNPIIDFHSRENDVELAVVG